MEVTKKPRDRLPTQIVCGMRLPLTTFGFHKDLFIEAVQMKPEEEDVFLVTYPKCGTTWTQYMVWEILHDAAVPPDNINRMMTEEIPYIEKFGQKVTEKISYPRIFKTHLPYRLVPKGKGVKYVFMFRNPFDVVTSLYHHMYDIHLTALEMEIDFDSFFEEFIGGRGVFGDYFEFLNEWYQHRNDPGVLFLRYEDMKSDPRKGALQIAQFIGDERRRRLEDNPEILERLLKHTSFDYMKKNMKFEFEAVVNPWSKVQKASGLKETKKTIKVNFFRTGQVGESKSLLSDEQWELIDQCVESRIHESGCRALLRLGN